MRKLQIIDTLIVSMDALADAHGTDRCVAILQAVKLLGELRTIIQAEEAERKEASE